MLVARDRNGALRGVRDGCVLNNPAYAPDLCLIYLAHIFMLPEARGWLATKGYDPKFGARPLARVIQKEVRDPLTDEILFGRLEHGGTVTINLVDGHLDFAYEARQPESVSQ